jgi:hypothetical protein
MVLILTALNIETMRRDSRFCKSRTIVRAIQYCESYLSACALLDDLQNANIYRRHPTLFKIQVLDAANQESNITPLNKVHCIA